MIERKMAQQRRRTHPDRCDIALADLHLYRFLVAVHASWIASVRRRVAGRAAEGGSLFIRQPNPEPWEDSGARLLQISFETMPGCGRMRGITGWFRDVARGERFHLLRRAAWNRRCLPTISLFRGARSASTPGRRSATVGRSYEKMDGRSATTSHCSFSGTDRAR